MTPQGKLLGVDHGLRRIGLAISDATWTLARELIIIERRSRAEDFARLNAIAQAEGAAAWIIGIPHHEAPEGVHTQADTVRLWISRLATTTALPIVEWDEQLTSEDAKMIARQQRRQRDAPLDDLAARVMLQSYLDALRDALAPFPLRS